MSDLCGQEMPTNTAPRPTCILPAGHADRVHRSRPPVHCWAPTFESGPEDTCPDCKHPWSAHSKEYGCELDWQYDADGMATTDGCQCLLAHVEKSVA